RDNGPVETRAFAASGFDAVTLAGPDNVRVVRGAAAGISATGPQAVLDRLDIHVEGSTLKVGRKREGLGGMWHFDWKEGGRNHATVTVTMPAIRGAAVAGSGDMIVDKADGDAFGASVAGSGSLTLASLAVARAKLDIAGSGNLVAVGSAPDAEASIAGSGDIDASRLTSDHASISIAGSGNVQVHARQSAEVSIIGSGDAIVTGTDNCKVSKMGSGSARCTR
ncbi:MAG: DUF2807 domain-containing protein, partial [Sphingomonadaceae bacterium]|nr:DUF2807 domain-containing protein [Sphingomonadaceae bacterium]